MARFSAREFWQLDSGIVLAPERYDPLREAGGEGKKLGSLVSIVSEQLDPRRSSCASRILVLDTGDAGEGIVRVSRSPVEQQEVGSNKKLVKAGDVIISRLRPYLRQVAFVDDGLFEEPISEGIVAVSTEFFVLRRIDQGSVAFLVPFLLSHQVQQVLAASQEGGHHPRVNQQTLERLVVPDAILARREATSLAVTTAVANTRRASLQLRELVAAVPAS